MALADIPVLLPWSIDLACVGTIFMIAGTLLGRAQFFEKMEYSVNRSGICHLHPDKLS